MLVGRHPLMLSCDVYTLRYSYFQFIRTVKTGKTRSNANLSHDFVKHKVNYSAKVIRRISQAEDKP